MPKVYLIDDDDAVRHSMQVLLSLHGCDVEPYAAGLDFLAQANLHCVGVVIVDLAMPRLSGEELQRRLIESASVLSVVIVTGAADVRSAVRVMQQGALTLLEKPFSEVELLEAVKAGIARSQALDAERSHVAAISGKLATLDADDRFVLERMIAGNSIKSCSTALHLSTRTIERRRKAILDLLGARSIPELAVLMEKVRLARPASPGPRQV